MKDAGVCVACNSSNTQYVTRLLASYGWVARCIEFEALSEVTLSGEIYYFSDKRLTDEQKKILDRLGLEGEQVVPLFSFFESKFKLIEPSLIVAKRQIVGNVFERKSYDFFKRLIDILISIFLLFLLSPLFFIVAVLIKMESRGPVLFIQPRVGWCGRSFNIMKFRSMNTQAEAEGPQWAQPKDSRVTRVGRFIRKTRIDEIPQLFNILKGEMSIIGPRPERRFFIDILDKEIPFYSLRHIVRPGLTGWAQINYPYGASVADSLWKHRYDLYYIKNRALGYDVEILLKTLKVIFCGNGR